MQMVRGFVLFTLMFVFGVIDFPVSAQAVIATIPVGNSPFAEAVNAPTNKTLIRSVSSIISIAAGCVAP